MTTSDLHEWYKRLFDKLMTALLMAQGIAYVCCGQKTWKTEEADRGLEADLSYYFDPEKIRVATEALARRSRERLDYPLNPDLAIEIDQPWIDRALEALGTSRRIAVSMPYFAPAPSITPSPISPATVTGFRPRHSAASSTSDDTSGRPDGS